MHIRRFALFWAENLSFSRVEQLPCQGLSMTAYPVFADSTLKNPGPVRMWFDKYLKNNGNTGPARPKTAVVKTYPVPRP